MRLTITAPAPLDGPPAMGATGPGAPLTVAIEDGVLVRPDGASDVVLPDGYALTPGLVDLQVNGLDDWFPLEDPSSLEGLDHALAASGVTGWLCAVPSAPAEQVRALAAAAHEVARDPGSALLGLHLEGPVLSPARAGAHAPEHLRAGDDAEALGLIELPGVRLVTLAPEVPGALGYARGALARGIAVAAGHTAATAEQATEAIGHGITLATHVFNAMPAFHQRAPGAAIAYLVHPKARPGFICDAEHLHDAVVELILASAGARAFLVSDSAPRDSLGRRPEDVLAGSRATLAGGVARVALQHRRGLAFASEMASARPAAAIGEGRRGRLEPGWRADLVVWTPDARVAACIRAGRIAFGALPGA